jgi:thioredoxin 2
MPPEVSAAMNEPLLIRCDSCGATNRVPPDRLRPGLAPVCGSCKRPLAVRPAPVIVTDANFADQVEHSPLPVLIDMWAPWCAPCRMLAPVVEELAAELDGRVRVAKLNVDENPITAGRFVIRNIPALLLLRAGREIDRIVGVQPKPEILRRVQRAIAS